MRWHARIVTPHRLAGCTVITESGRAYRVLAITNSLDLVVEPAKPIGAFKRFRMRMAAELAGLIEGLRRVP